MKFFGRYWVILILCLTVIGMAVVKTKFGFKGKYVAEIIPQPTEIPKPTLVPGFEVLGLLPYSGTGFVIDKYLAPNELNVKIKGIDQKLATKMVFKWLEENKVATESYKLKFE